ncbi:MAG TPA: pilus assembly protein TadG-related protein [Candidatus Dormibacteraeota bacterium]
MTFLKGNAKYPRFQRGQAIVLIAIMLAVVVGMAALAIDGSRAYALRRDLQAAADAAALAAGDSLQQTGSYILAEQAATASFGSNMRLYSSPSCSPGYGSPSATMNPRTITCTYSDGTVLKQVVTALGPGGTQFTVTATRSLVLQFARILTNGTTPKLSAVASGGVNNLLYAPTIAALSQGGCGGVPGNAISVTTGGTLTVVGDVVSTGAISIAGLAQVAGDVYARCQSSVANVRTTCYPSGNATPCTFPDVAGTTKSGYNFVDPNYPPPAVVAGSQATPADNVVLPPGTYAGDPAIAAGKCYFLSGGVYGWLSGYTSNGGFVSNELKPLDEPNPTNNTLLANQQFWNTNGVSCAGAYGISAIGGSAIPKGTWAVELTSARTDTYGGVTYKRESAPSMCRTVFVDLGQVVQLQISNVPGATSYGAYVSPPPNGCAGPFGLAAYIPVVGSVQNNSTVGTCPAFTGTSCSLGNQTLLIDAPVLGFKFAPNALAPPGTFQAYPPDSETAPLQSGLPNQNPNRSTPPAGDRANENQCETVAAALSPCPGPITPGAVVFKLPNGSCLNDTNAGDNFVFSGYQYNWVVTYEPGAAHPPANACSNVMGAAGNSAYIGLVYLPSASLSVPSSAGFSTKATGGMIANTITFNSVPPMIVGSSAYMPVPPAARLVG